MKDDFLAQLTDLGLTKPEARIYLALAKQGSLGANALAAVIGVARPSVYPLINSLVDKGLVEAGEGYGSRFSLVPPRRGLPQLLIADREALSHRERLTEQLVARIADLEDRDEGSREELIQVIRSPRAVAERFDRLQLEAREQIQVFTKPPFFMRSGNPVQDKVLKRGVRARSLYEKAALEDAGIRPYLDKWVSAGEDARIYDGELPHKLVIFDSKVVLMPLIRPGEQTKTLLIRHPQLAQSLSLAFEHLWERSAPVHSGNSENNSKPQQRHLRKRKQPKKSRRATLSASVVSRCRNHRTRRHNPALVR